MSDINQILNKYNGSEKLSELIENIKSEQNCLVKNALGSSKAIITSYIYNELKKPLLFILPEKEDAAYFYNDLLNLFDENKVLFFPSSYKRSIQYDQIEQSNIVLRTDVLNKINTPNFNPIIISYPEALVEKVISKQNLKENTLSLKTGEVISTQFIIEVLVEYGFERVDFVIEPGQYSSRGSIIDIFSFANDLPYRIDFFGDEVDSIRTFNIENQISIEKLNKISIIPNIQEKTIANIGISFFDFIATKTIICINDSKYCFEQVDKIYNHTINKQTESEDIESHISSSSELKTILLTHVFLEFNSTAYFEVHTSIDFNINKQPAFNKNFDLLVSDLESKIEEAYDIYICSSNTKQIERLKSIFIDKETKIDFNPLINSFHEGFIDPSQKLCLYTDHQIFDRYHRYRLKERFNNKASVTLNEINSLKPGDYVVHIDHGICIFGGLEKIEVNNKPQEAIKLVFKDKDVLYVNIHSLHRISKYKGKDGEQPKIYKLGTGTWQKLKQNTKKKVKDIAKDLIELYAKRKEQKGFIFSQNTYLNNELEASFIYEDTPDQIKSNLAVKMDMESEMPMDRLICGDVGFGKTEIAIRAAFKAVCDNKQVAILVPTTILALQHYNTFSERLNKFPCTVEYLTRLVPAKKQKEIISNLSTGKVDIIIGTHKLISKEIKYKDLGLLIIDEEQKFGVAMKEKLKQLKINVDTVTLTATPIPRTLQFSLMGVRDLSIIQTPPPNRHPIITEIHTFNEDIIKEAIEYEIERGGQVFYIHNRVQNIDEIESMINRICPTVKTAIAHGQMDGKKLEGIMTDFIDGDYGILIATSIIENGLDIANANTIIINNAHHFGLSDLHQLRGRVGRSNKKAFCYLLAPPQTLMTPDARRRLKAIEEYSEIGSGFNIALQDLDIRGAGNLLGGEQSGFIADIGFETYQRILNEAIQELKESEFKDLFTNSDSKPDAILANLKFLSDCIIDTDLELLFTETYISNISERIKLYRRLDSIENEEDLNKFEADLIDRFGILPEQTIELLNVVRLRWIAVNLGFEKIILKNKMMICYFITNQDSMYYQSQIFSGILSFLQKNPSKFIIKENKEKLSLTIMNIDSIEKAILTIRKIEAYLNNTNQAH